MLARLSISADEKHRDQTRAVKSGNYKLRISEGVLPPRVYCDMVPLTPPTCVCRVAVSTVYQSAPSSQRRDLQPMASLLPELCPETQSSSSHALLQHPAPQLLCSLCLSKLTMFAHKISPDYLSAGTSSPAVTSWDSSQTPVKVGENIAWFYGAIWTAFNMGH